MGDTKKTEFTLTLFDNPKNREKASVLGALEIMLDDEDNPLPPSWDLEIQGEAGKDVPWGTKFKVMIERL